MPDAPPKTTAVLPAKLSQDEAIGTLPPSTEPPPPPARRSDVMWVGPMPPDTRHVVDGVTVGVSLRFEIRGSIISVTPFDTPDRGEA